jgi:EAL domain-containing protein (putative c-di-GMP-specific phosphodiesterase class I)
MAAEPVRPPDQWFAQAHRCGLGAELEAAALRAALAAGPPPGGAFLALNVSPAALLDAPVRAALPADLSGIVIELTEHQLFSTGEDLQQALAELRARGARIALDDAGAGYAGLQQLIHVAPDILKLDRSLVHGAHADASKLALLEALITFADSTGAAVCGEGIEDLADLHVLVDLNVTYAQGYGLARPGAAWQELAAAAVNAAAEVRAGARVSPAAGRGAGSWARNLGELAEALATVEDHSALERVGVRAAQLLAAEDAALMVVRDGMLEQIAGYDHDQGGCWPVEDYPATKHVIETRRPAQVVVGDPAADPAELEELQRIGMGALLMIPVAVAGGSLALMEVYRRRAQPFSVAEIDRARVVALQFAAVLGRL